MGRKYVVICDSCGKTVEDGKYYRVTASSGRKVEVPLNNKAFYICQECVLNGCIGNAIKKTEGEKA